MFPTSRFPCDVCVFFPSFSSRRIPLSWLSNRIRQRPRYTTHRCHARMSRSERYDHVLSEEFDDYEHRTTCCSCRGGARGTDHCCRSKPRFAYVALALVAVLLAVGLATFYGSRYFRADGRTATTCRWRKPADSAPTWPTRPHGKCRSARGNQRPVGFFDAFFRSTASSSAKS